MAVFGRVGESRMQVLDLGDQLVDLRLQQRNLAHPRPQGGMLGFQLGDAVVWRHAPRLHP
jgi:hypothetical protein